MTELLLQLLDERLNLKIMDNVQATNALGRFVFGRDAVLFQDFGAFRF